MSNSNNSKLITVNFEVFGRVQGVFFRKYTQKKAQELSITGWCRNTHRDTVEGTLEGPVEKIDVMKNWLERVGSPSAVIDKTVFKDKKEIQSLTYPDFTIKK